MRGGAVLWLFILSLIALSLPAPSHQRTLIKDDEHLVRLHLGASPDQLDKHHKHKHPPPPPSPPTPSPPPPPAPPATLASLAVSNGALLAPPFRPDVHRYHTTVGEGVTEIRVTVSVPDRFEVYEAKVNSSRLVSGQASPPVPIRRNGETVNLVITISAPNHSTNKYYLSVHRVEKPSVLRRILRQTLVVVLVMLLISCVLYITFSILRASPYSLPWLLSSCQQQPQYQPVNIDDPSP